jgi:hypothetical protein
MILVDYSQVAISNLMKQLSVSKGELVLNEELVRHMILNSLRGYRQKFFQEYGELVICCDATDVWRKTIFPFYKAGRKKHREDSVHDWNNIFTILNKIRDEIRDHMPYKSIRVDHAEADDIIGVICSKYGRIQYEEARKAEKILILSGDKDFTQLQKYANVFQYSPVLKKFLTIDNPERFRREHIMLGDKGDGIPNFLSPDDTFVNNRRQRQLSRKKLLEWIEKDPMDFCDDEMLRGYRRNETLVDLEKVPSHIRESCLTAFEVAVATPRSNLLNYFMQNRLRNLVEKIGEF